MDDLDEAILGFAGLRRVLRNTVKRRDSLSQTNREGIVYDIELAVREDFFSILCKILINYILRLKNTGLDIFFLTKSKCSVE